MGKQSIFYLKKCLKISKNHIKALNNIRAGDTHGEGYASAFQHTSIADDSVFKIDITICITMVDNSYSNAACSTNIAKTINYNLRFYN